MKVNVPIETLARILETNLIKHALAYTEAIAGYRKATVVKLQKILTAIADGGEIPSNISPPTDRPESHVDDYKKVIGLLKLSAWECFELDEEEYDQYINDNWHWRNTFSSSCSSYASSSSLSSSHENI